MLLGTYREVELDEALPFHEALLGFTRRRLGSRVKLERLNKSATGDMLGIIFAEETTPEFLEGIYKETEGNPFFIEEVCKALVESGQVWYEDGEWHRAPSMEDLSIPQGVKVAIQSRVSKLTDGTQSILLTAAVIGREFDYQTLGMVTGKGEEALIDCLEEAISKQLIEELKEGGGDQFSFLHALIPSTLREGIIGLRRIRLHRQVATAIEALHPEDFERLAYHWGEAGDEGRGLEYTIKAAERAQQSYVNEDAVRLYSEALSLISEDDPKRFELLAGRAEVYNVMAEREAQLADVEMMLVLAENRGDEARRVEALLALAELYLETETNKAREPSEQALMIARELGDAGREGRALYCLGSLAHMLSEFDDGRMHFENSAACLRQAGLKGETAESLGSLSLEFGFLGDSPAALEAAQEALDLSKEVGDKLLEATTTRKLAIAYLSNYQYAEALPIAEAALQMFREVGDISGETHALNVLGIIKQGLEFLEEAEADYIEALRIAESISQDVVITWVAKNLGYLYARMGQHEKSLGLIEVQLDEARLSNNKSLAILLQAEKMDSLYLLGKYEQALNLAETILPDYEKLVDKGLQARALSFRGILCAELGKFERAHQYLENAIERCSGIKGPNTELVVPVDYAQAAVVEGESSTLQVGLERVKGAVIYAREHHNLTSPLGQALWIEACIHLALLEENSSQAESALECTEEALKAFEIEQQVMPEQIHFQHSRALRVNGLEEEADKYLREAFERVMMVAGNINDEDLRRSYLENVRGNREIQAAYQERFGS
jgi:predicted ATPase